MAIVRSVEPEPPTLHDYNPPTEVLGYDGPAADREHWLNLKPPSCFAEFLA